MAAEPTNGTQTKSSEAELSRDLGLPSALAIGIGTMIAAGIFTLSGLAVGYVGSAAIVSFLLAAVVASFTALAYCEFTSIYPESGEGYLYARRTFPAPLAYLVGWCLLLGYTASCGFYIASLSTYFNEFIWHSPVEMASGVFVVVALTLLNIRGAKESGQFQIVVTIAKVALLIWFIVGGLGSIETEVVVERFSTDWLKIGSTAALVFVTFFGFSAIAASAGEIKNPKKTIPRSIFISMIVVTALYSAVVLVVVAANLTSYDEAAMGVAARNFLGPIGGMVIVAGALFSMIAAANASILAGSRVALAMSQRGHLPREVGTINANTRTPIIALVLVGGAIGAFALLMPLEPLANFANVVLLVALTLVNAALIYHRRKFPYLKRPFRVPLVPVVPILGMAACVYLLTQVDSIDSIVIAAVAILVGFLGFIAWKGAQDLEAVALPGRPSKVALERDTGGDLRDRILVPIANPKTALQLVDVAASIAKQRNAKLVVVRVIVVPVELTPDEEEKFVEKERELLDQARDRAAEHGVPIRAIVRIGQHAARAILETSRDHKCKLIVLGWKGFATQARAILGEVTDDVVNHAQTDIMLVRLHDEGTPMKRLFLPSAGGVHARRAEEYAAHIAAEHEGKVTLCSVVHPDAQSEELESEEERLLTSKKRMQALEDVDVDIEILRSRAVSETIVEAAKQHDAVVMGASGASYSSQVLFGSIPEDIARVSDRPVIVVKRHHAAKALFGRVMTE